MPMIVLGNTLLIYSSNLCLEEQIKDEKITKCVSSNSYLVTRTFKMLTGLKELGLICVSEHVQAIWLSLNTDLILYCTMFYVH